jgi:methylated-DNA-[protein]-cysteine S-methyltransferase
MATGKPQYNAVIDLPFGRLAICADDDGLSLITPVMRATRLQKADNEIARETCRQLQAYVTNPGFCFSLPIKESGTPFQNKVWRVLRQIPNTQTVAYGELAQTLRTSARAIGNACRRNPVPIVVPCHRVVARNGSGGYMGKRGGSALQIKKWLLQHEAGSQ